MSAPGSGTSTTSSASCYTNTITVQPVSNSGTNGTCISTPHIVQYPKVPRRDDGKWMAMGSIIGGLIGKFANEDKLNEASDAEDTWKDLNDQLKAKGLEEWLRVPLQRELAAAADDRLKNAATKNWNYEVAEKAYSDSLKECDTALHDRLCALAQCGYIPDYTGILNRARGDAAAMVSAKKAELQRFSSRYNTCKTAAMCADLNNVEITAALSAATVAREAERQAAWKFNWDTLTQATQIIEADRLNRAKLAADYDRVATTVEQFRYTGHTTEAEGALKIGADMLASAGQNYAWLAESLRRSAEKDTGNFASLGALILPLLLSVFGDNCQFTSKDCDCVDTSGSTTPPTTP